MNHYDLERAVRKDFPHARIDKIDSVNQAQARAESTPARLKDERNRLLDAATGNGDLTKVRSVDGLFRRGRYRSSGEVPALTWSGKKFVIKIYRPRDGSDPFAKWVNPDNIPPSVAFGDLRETRLADLTRLKPEKCCPIPDYPMVAESENVSYTAKGKRRLQPMTHKRLGGLEILNENIGGQMRHHGDPATVEEFRKRGILQTRRDQNGNPCEYMVAGSRKEQAALVREYNQRQKESKDRGWKGTFSRTGVNVKFIRHGDQSDGL